MNNLFIAKQEHQAEESCLAANVVESSHWSVYQTPEGYWYYFNNQTRGK